MSEKAGKNDKKVVPQDNSDASDIAKLIEAVRAAEGAWRSLTDGEADLRLTASTKKALKKPVTLRTLRMLRPMVLRQEALSAWWRATDRVVGWALSAEVATHHLLKPVEDDNPDSAFKNSDRWALYKFLMTALHQGADAGRNYVLVTFPKQLAKELSEALICLDYGEVAPLFEPSSRKSFKDGYTIPNIREELLWCAHYIFGRGSSMAEAYRQVGDAIGQSADAVRNWDRGLLYDDRQLSYDFKIARLRGAVDSGAELIPSLRRLKVDASDRMTSLWDDLQEKRFEPHDLREVAARYRTAIAEQSKAARRARTRPRSR